MEEKDSISYTDLVAEMTRYLDALNVVKSNQSTSYDFGDDVDITLEELTQIANNGYSKGISKLVNGSGTTIQYSNPRKEKQFTLTRDGGYFVYWLMIHISFLEDEGFKSKYSDITRNLTTSWGRSLIHSGLYNGVDRDFLREVRQYMTDKKWVYKKPVLNEYNDYLEYLEKLPETNTNLI